MPEHAPSQEQFETLPMPETHNLLPDAEHAEPLRPGEADPLERLEAARSAIEAQAERDNPLDKLDASEKAAHEPAPQPVNRELKNITLGRELKQIRRQLKTPDRALSRVIHQPVVRAISETSAKTVARSSGLLGGAVTAFIGSTSYLWFARHIGLQYNYLLFLLFFVGGFILGLAIELAVWALTHNRRTLD